MEHVGVIGDPFEDDALSAELDPLGAVAGEYGVEREVEFDPLSHPLSGGEGLAGHATLGQAEEEIDMTLLDADERATADAEVRLLSSLTHEHIVNYHGDWVEDGALYVLMEYAEGGDLDAYLRNTSSPLPESLVRRWFKQLLSAVVTIHERGIVHRDIKPGNVMLSATQDILLGDFGVARTLGPSQMAQTAVGTPFSLSPEQCSGLGYGPPSDMWALGCLIYELMCRSKPFGASNMAALVVKILQAEPDPMPPTYSPDLRILVSACLGKAAGERPSARELSEQPYFDDVYYAGITAPEHIVGVTGVKADGESGVEVRGNMGLPPDASAAPSSPLPPSTMAAWIGNVQDRLQSLDRAFNSPVVKGDASPSHRVDSTEGVYDSPRQEDASPTHSPLRVAQPPSPLRIVDQIASSDRHNGGDVPREERPEYRDPVRDEQAEMRERKRKFHRERREKREREEREKEDRLRSHRERVRQAGRQGSAQVAKVIRSRGERSRSVSVSASGRPKGERASQIGQGREAEVGATPPRGVSVSRVSGRRQSRGSVSGLPVSVSVRPKSRAKSTSSVRSSQSHPRRRPSAKPSPARTKASKAKREARTPASKTPTLRRKTESVAEFLKRQRASQVKGGDDVTVEIFSPYGDYTSSSDDSDTESVLNITNVSNI
ncbi:hypothetical protein KIPB_004671 [Kipferlia bialata]|uniref:non-specific serine/threonine protein kinase n=1 Tax=Kipferlia bialata TaxID=797122 RepID=A0A9K3CU59_9EUKA|nr:hypothetical protein KIPB_004671 [Kipferlia bialata]|eukprot:g4671.t1